jgi:hypothetical protein
MTQVSVRVKRNVNTLEYYHLDKNDKSFFFAAYPLVV